MTQSDETGYGAVPTTFVESAQLRVGQIGQVTGLDRCWRLAYDHCDHVQDFAREGLEDPARLVLFVERNFPECLSCRFIAHFGVSSPGGAAESFL